MKSKVLAIAALSFIACAEDQEDLVLYESSDVERRSIEVSVDSSGVVEPLATVEVKSKASGEVLELLIEVGDYVDRPSIFFRA